MPDDHSSEAGPSTWRSPSPLASPSRRSVSSSLRPSSSGETYAQIAARQLNEVRSSGTGNSGGHGSLGSWSTEDIDRAEHLDQLSSYEGIMEGHNWPIAPAPRSPSTAASARDNMPPFREPTGTSGSRTVEEGQRRIAPMITLDDILGDQEERSASPLGPPPAAPPRASVGWRPMPWSPSPTPSPTRRSQLAPAGAAVMDDWPSDPVAGDIRRILGDLATLPHPSPAASSSRLATRADTGSNTMSGGGVDAGSAGHRRTALRPSLPPGSILTNAIPSTVAETLHRSAAESAVNPDASLFSRIQDMGYLSNPTRASTTAVPATGPVSTTAELSERPRRRTMPPRVRPMSRSGGPEAPAGIPYAPEPESDAPPSTVTADGGGVIHRRVYHRPSRDSERYALENELRAQEVVRAAQSLEADQAGRDAASRAARTREVPWRWRDSRLDGILGPYVDSGPGITGLGEDEVTDDDEALDAIADADADADFVHPFADRDDETSNRRFQAILANYATNIRQRARDGAVEAEPAADAQAGLSRGGNNRRRAATVAIRRVAGAAAASAASAAIERANDFAGGDDMDHRLPAWVGGTRSVDRRSLLPGHSGSRARSGVQPTNNADIVNTALPVTLVRTHAAAAAAAGDGSAAPHVEAAGNAHDQRATATRGRSTSTEGGVADTDRDGRQVKRRKLDAATRGGYQLQQTTDRDASKPAGAEAEAESPATTPARPSYLRYTTLPTSTPLPTAFIMPARTSHLALTSTLPPPSTRDPSTSAGPTDTIPRPLISFTSHPPSTSSDSDACALHTSLPIPAGVGVYYFEITVLDSGPEGYMSLGFMRRGVKLRRLVGWEKGTWGWHADDGRAFEESGSGKDFGPNWGVGDTVGAGIDYTTRRAFFTKNGKLVGHTFRNLPTGLYPAVGLRNPRESVSVNLTGPFVFDIDTHAEAMCRATRQQARDQQVTDVPFLHHNSPAASAGPRAWESATQSVSKRERAGPLGELPVGHGGLSASITAGTLEEEASGPLGQEHLMPVSGTETSPAVPPPRTLARLSPGPTLAEPASKGVTALVLDYLSHNGLDSVKALVIRDLARRKMLVPSVSAAADTEPAFALEANTPANVSMNRQIQNITSTIQQGDRIPWAEIGELVRRSRQDPGPGQPAVALGTVALEASCERRMRILDVVCTLQRSDLRQEPDETTALTEARGLVTASETERWTSEERGWVREAVSIISGRADEEVWAARRKEWSEDLAGSLRDTLGLRYTSYLEQAIVQNRTTFRRLIEHGDGAAAFVHPDEYMRSSSRDKTV